MRALAALAAVLVLCSAALASPESDLALLKAAYPEACRAVETDASGRTWLILADGTRLVYDDGRAKTAEEALDHPDVRDMLAQPYPPGPVTAEPAKDFHPGRVRVEAFFKAVYGHSAAEVRANLVPVSFLGKTVLFSSRAGAADALRAVDRELAALTTARPELKRFILPLSGTYAWRTIARTGRLSVHSFGAAIDLNHKVNTYWQWYTGDDPLGLRKAFPAEIVDVFERHGFIWGGKWAEFDIMHFEYRPELLAKARQGR